MQNEKFDENRIYTVPQLAAVTGASLGVLDQAVREEKLKSACIRGRQWVRGGDFSTWTALECHSITARANSASRLRLLWGLK